MQWLYRLIRQRTKPVPRHKARLFYDRISVVYYMLAWTAGGYAFMQIITYDPTVLPDELNVHADPKDKNSSNIYKMAQKINKPNPDSEMKVITFRNFSYHNTETLNVQNLKEKVGDTLSRQSEDFFGGEDHKQEPGEELPSTM